MRITLRVTQAGDCWSFTPPKVDLPACYPKDENGVERFDEAEFRRQIANESCVQIGSNDSGLALAFAAIFCSSLNDWLDDNTHGDEDSPRMERVRARLAAKAERKNFAAVRIDFANADVDSKGKRVRTLRIRIRADQRDTVGFPFATDCALLVADFIEGFSRRYTEKGDPPFVYADETRALLDELHRRTAEDEAERKRKEANINRHKCERLVNGFCSPCKFDCPHYRSGKCVDV